ncbi:hypothetical protein [Microbulbifer sp. THAF38]|uniref:hypothetical protein n=1 Tax=Microbulbifer sp. THAF38 TaxID=2587856 RepID=UPI001267DFC8|nr:hypothetical protein [Microbulbifer sp. THAF38]QFT54990.1 elongation factor Ts [Microbulbifer sp. THAF38]
MTKFIETYNHQNRIGVMIEFACSDAWAFETDEFREFSRDIALHIAANGELQEPLVTQLFLKEPSETVGHQFKLISNKLGVKITIAKYEYYGASKI